MLSSAVRHIPKSLVARSSRNACASQALVAGNNNNITTNFLLNNSNNNIDRSERWMSSSSDELPYHLVVGMPALSPTMETGTIATWKVAEGDSFGAGDSLAEIETDKATIDFEAQDEGVVAKILMQAGVSDIKVGVPILVTVEEADDVSAFANFVPEITVEEPEPEPVVEEKKPAVVETPVVAASPPPPPPAPVVAAVTSTPAPVVATPPPIVEEVVPSMTSDTVVTVGPAWGNLARVKSPLAEALSIDQKKYIETYGSTGQIPL